MLAAVAVAPAVGSAPAERTGPRAATVASAPATVSAATIPAGAVQVDPGPSIAYEESVAHAGKTYRFVPGAAVSVPFRSRSSFSASPRGASGPSPRAASGISAAAAAGLRREVYGFLPYWELVDPDMRLDYASLSTIAYFSVGATADGSLVTRNADGTTTSGWGGWTSQAMTDVIDAAHASGVRVDFTVTLFAWTSSQAKNQAALLGSPTARSQLVGALVSAVVGRGADGVNLDIEPLVSGHEDDLVAFVRELRGALDAAGPGRRITVDVLGSTENYPHENLVAPGAADALFVMGYDYRTAGAAYAGSISPLVGNGYDLTDTVNAYLARVPASRLILGIPYYGRAWSTVSDALHAKTQSSSKNGYSATANYALAASLAEENGRRWDEAEQVPWTAYRRSACDTCPESWRELYYDDVESLRLKYALADSRDLAGVGIWALGYDGTRPELAALLRETFGGAAVDTTPPKPSLAVVPADAPDEGIVVSWSATDASGVATYDVQVAMDGGPWSDWLVGAPTTSEVWPGRDRAGYAFRVRATDTAGNVSAWTTEDARTTATALAKGGFVRVVASSVALRAAPSTTAKKLATVRAGDVLLVTAGPRSAGGASWVQVSGPITTWPIVAAVRTKAWIAVRQGTTVLAAPTRRPWATVVAAGFAGYSFDGAGAASLGPEGAAHRAFSPGTGAARARLTVAWRGRVAMTAVSARILRADGSLVGSVALGNLPAGARTWTWDGKVAGSIVPDGSYLIQLVGKGGGITYRAPSARPGSPAQVARFGIAVDTVPPVLAPSSISSTVLAPVSPGGPTTVTVTGSAPDAATWTVTVVPASGGGPVRTFAGAGSTATATWDGTDATGRRLPRGTYHVTLSMADIAGNTATAAWDVDLQVPGPSLAATVDPPAIAPDGDGVADRATIRWTSDVPVTGTVRVLRATAVVRSWPIETATSGIVRWDGTDARGKPAAEGRYTVVVDAANAAGDPATAEIPLVVDRTVRSFVATPPRFAPADGDALAPSTRISYTLSRPATTRLAILDPAGTEIRVVWEGRSQAAGTVGWTWDGRIDGAFVADGTYTFDLKATTALGTIDLRRPVPVGAFEIRLSSATVSAGDSLVVTAIAAEPLRSAPSITFTQAGLAPVKKTATAAGTDRWTATFTVAAGGAGSATVTVAARDTAGGVEVSRATVTVA